MAEREAMKRILAYEEIVEVYISEGFVRQLNGVFRHKETRLKSISPLQVEGCYFFAGRRDPAGGYDWEYKGSEEVKNAEQLRSLIRHALRAYRKTRAIAI